jgi:hypothetical protein
MIHACSSSCRPRRWRKPRSTAFSPQTDCRVVGESEVRDAAEAASKSAQSQRLESPLSIRSDNAAGFCRRRG